MKQVFRVFWGCTLAAALALTGCGRGGAPGSSGAGSMSGSGSGAMSGGTAGQEQAWRTGLGVVTEAAGSDRAGKICCRRSSSRWCWTPTANWPT